MFQKLDSIERKFVELEDSLQKPGLDGKELMRLSKERASIEELVTTYRKYRELLKRQADAKLMLEESDAEMRALAKDELDEVSEEIVKTEQELRILTLPKDPNDERNVILEIRAGTGGEEAALFVADLIRMYSKYADKRRWRMETLSSNPSDKGGFKEVVVLIEGDKVYSRMKYESGTHRVQRVPDTEAQGRIHTSAVTVAILPEADEVEEVPINPADLDITVCRASGAGGQHINTTDSAVRIVHKPTGVVVECQDERSQHKNKEKAMKVLRARLLEQRQREQQAAISAERKSQVGSGDRSERIRTYNFPQGRLTDHRINLTLYQLGNIMEGDLDHVMDSLTTHYQTEALKQELAAT